MSEALEITAPDSPEIDSAVSQIDPFGGQLLVVKDDLPSQIGRIHLPEKNELRPFSGVVRKAGPSARELYPEGTRVLFSQFAGNEIGVSGVKLLILQPIEVLATVSEEARLDAAS